TVPTSIRADLTLREASPSKRLTTRQILLEQVNPPGVPGRMRPVEHSAQFLPHRVPGRPQLETTTRREGPETGEWQRHGRGAVRRPSGADRIPACEGQWCARVSRDV